MRAVKLIKDKKQDGNEPLKCGWVGSAESDIV